MILKKGPALHRGRIDSAGRSNSAPHCRICGHGGRPRERVPAPLPMFRCGECGTVQTEELPSDEELGRFYGTAYLDDYTAGMGAAKFAREMPRRHLAKLKLVQKLAAPATLLDVGCGEGDFLWFARRAGIEAIGCDFALRSTYPDGVTVQQGSLDRELPFPDASFDAVTCWAVLEHVRRPTQAIRELARVLRPGGYLFLDTPLADDWCERLVAARSHWFCPPEHIHLFSAGGFRRLVEQADLRVARHWPFFERNIPRFFARRLRNLAVGLGVGGAIRLAAPRLWRDLRSRKISQIGDIQLLVAVKPQ